MLYKFSLQFLQGGTSLDSFKRYHSVPKFSDRQVWANSVDPDQTPSLIRVYTVCHSVCIFWARYSMVEPHCSNFRIITATFRVSEYLEILW